VREIIEQVLEEIVWFRTLSLELAPLFCSKVSSFLRSNRENY